MTMFIYNIKKYAKHVIQTRSAVMTLSTPVNMCCKSIIFCQFSCINSPASLQNSREKQQKKQSQPIKKSDVWSVNSQQKGGAPKEAISLFLKCLMNTKRTAEWLLYQWISQHNDMGCNISTTCLITLSIMLLPIYFQHADTKFNVQNPLIVNNLLAVCWM